MIFLRTVKPFVSADEYRETENLAKNFSSAGSIGEKLQKLLEERAANTENWVNFKICIFGINFILT